MLFDVRQSWVGELLRLHPQIEARFSEQDLRYYLVPSDFDVGFYRHLDTFSPDKKQTSLYDLH